MTDPTLTVLIGSAGRETLVKSLESIQRQRRLPGDQVIVAFDSFEFGERQDMQDAVQAFGDGFLACAYDAGYHWYGVEQINHALRTIPITGSHVLTIGDDDVFVDGAYGAIRSACAIDMDRAVLWKFRAPWNELLWEVPQMRMSRISGCCIAAPVAHVGPMSPRNTAGELYVEHDFDWMQSIIQRSGKEPLWLDQVLVIARPPARGDDVLHKGIVRCWSCRLWRWAEDVDILNPYCPKCGVVIPAHEMTGVTMNISQVCV